MNKVVKIGWVLAILMSFTGCSTIKGLGDSLTSLPKSGYSSPVGNKREAVFKELVGMRPDEVRTYFGKPVYEGLGYFTSNKAKDFLLVYPLHEKGDNTTTVTRVTYNMNKKKYCLYIYFRAEDQYRLRADFQNWGATMYGGESCIPWQKGFKPYDLRFKEVKAEDFLAMTKK